MALLERLEIVIEADARTAEREFDRIGRQATESLESIETAAAEVGDNASKRLADAAPEFARAGERLSDAAGRELDLSAAAEKAAADLPRAVDSQRQEMEQAGRRAGDAAGGGVADGVRGAGAQVRGAGDRLGGEVGDGVSGGILESLGGLGGDLSGAMDDALGALPAGVAGPVAAAGALIGAGLVNGISDAIETENLGDVIAARVGEGAAASEQFARVTSEVFRDAWGESTAEVADAVDAVYSTLADSRGSEEALQDLTTRAQAFAQVFNQDVGQAVSNAGVLIETGLARDAVEAFDLMTAAAQRVPAAMRDELGEATQEYSTFFAALGFDGRESFAILTDAAVEGRYELDKTGDAIKELSIRATDLADTAAVDALENLGLNARDTANALLEGGESARIATQQILDALSSVEDPAEQAQIAIALMGAPLEDLNKQEIPEFIDRLATASTGMRDAAGASDELTTALENSQTSLTVLKRELLGGFEDLADNLLAPAAAVADGETSWQELGQSLGDAFMEGIGLTPLGMLAEAPVKFWADILGVDQEVDILGLILGGGTTPSGDNSFLWERLGLNPGPPELGLDDIPADAERARASLEDINTEIELSNDLFGLAAERASNYLQRIADSTDLDDAISAQLNLRDAAAQLADGLGALQGVDIEGFAAGTVQVSDDAADALGDVAGAASAAQQQIANALQFEGEDAALETAGELRDRFVELFDAAGLTDEQIIDLLASMGLLPEQITTAIELSGADEALAKLDLLSARYEEKIPAEVQTQIDIAIAEGRFVDAANLISLWVKDQEDGYIDNPLLVAMGLGDTTQASADVDTWKRGEENKPPAGVRVGADTSIAYGAVNEFLRQANNARANVTVGVRFANEGLGAFPIFGRRAGGGPVTADQPYLVGERGPELFMPSSSGTVLSNGDTAAALKGNNVTINQTIITPDPMVSAAESARKLRDASYLVGA